MGCLIELLGELFIEIVLGGLFHIYSGLMSLIVPDSMQSQKLKKRIENTIKAACAILLLILVIGVILMLCDIPSAEHIGKWMVYPVLMISALQIILGIIVRILLHRKNKQ